MDYEIREITDKNLWENFVSVYLQGSFLQSWNWGELDKKMGNQIKRLGVVIDNKLCSGMQIFIRTAKRGKFLAIPGGPLINWENKDEVNSYFDKISEIAKKEKVWFVRVRPNLTNFILGEAVFQKYGYIKAPMPLHAENVWCLDLTPPAEELLAKMRKSTRYEIRRAQREGVRVHSSRNPDEIKILWELQNRVAQRKGFVPFRLDFLEMLFRVFARDQEVKLFLGKFKDKVLSAALIIFYGNSAYYYVAAFSEDYRSLPGSQHLVWQAILEAKKENLNFFNFMGISSPNRQNHPWAKVTFFKQGFGGERVDYVKTHDLPLSPFYWATYLWESWQSRQRGI